MANSVYAICKKIRFIKESEFDELIKLGEEQATFVHPLKHKKQSTLNRLGNNNLAIIEHLKQIQEIIENNKP